jgi:sugar lactone lactonase YvrE
LIYGGTKKYQVLLFKKRPYCKKADDQVELTILADYNDLCGEAPLWDARTKTLYWTDIAGKRFYRLDWTRREHQILRSGFEVAGYAFCEQGGFVVVNAEGVWYWDGTDNCRLLISEADGTKCQLNDCIADPKGRLFTGSWFYDPSRENYPLGNLIRVDTDGSAHVVDEGIHLANGLGFSPENNQLYFSDSVARLIYVYDYRESDGRVTNRRVLKRFEPHDGLPDGLTVDAEGFIWCALWFGSALVRLDPEGMVQRKIRIPATQTSSLAFGGPDWTDIFITSANLSEASPLAPPGYKAEKVYSGGRLFYTNLGIRGKEEYRCNVTFDN